MTWQRYALQVRPFATTGVLIALIISGMRS